MKDNGAESISYTEASLRSMIQQKDAAYTERNAVVALCMRLAAQRGYRVGLGEDPTAEPEWQNVAFLDLPSGQVSFHFHVRDQVFFTGLPVYPGTWDGHDTEEKYRRVKATEAR